MRELVSVPHGTVCAGQSAKAARERIGDVVVGAGITARQRRNLSLMRDSRIQLRHVGTLHELTKLAPAAIIAEALGYSPATIERHAKASGAEYAQYVAAVIDAGPSAVQ